MLRPHFITDSDIVRWSDNLDHDPNVSPALVASPVIREVCYAGLWLAEQLVSLNCPDDIIVRIQWEGGRLSFGRNPWDVHQQLLEAYQNNELIFEDDHNLEIN